VTAMTPQKNLSSNTFNYTALNSKHIYTILHYYLDKKIYAHTYDLPVLSQISCWCCYCYYFKFCLNSQFSGVSEVRQSLEIYMFGKNKCQSRTVYGMDTPWIPINSKVLEQQKAINELLHLVIISRQYAKKHKPAIITSIYITLLK